MSSRKVSQKQKQVAAAYARKAGLKVSGLGAYRKGSHRTAKPRVVSKVKGRGDYRKDYGKELGGLIGEGLQELLTQLGGVMGIGKAVAGVGDYVRAPWEVKSNSLLSMGNDPPEVINSRTGGVIVRHREYLKDIITSSTAGEFKVEQFPIQPGNYITFPWLYQIAQNFEQYKLRGMIFEFKSTSADALNSVNTALGTVVMATEYDSSKPGFTNKSQMENHQYGMSAKQSCSMLHPIECASPQSTLDTLYIRTPEEASPDTDIRMYDFGNFSIATVGQQGTEVNIGELWVTYELELLKPQLRGAGGDALTSMYVFTGPMTSLLPFGALNSIQANENNSLELSFDQTHYAAGAVLLPDTFPAGTYMMIYGWGSSSSIVAPPTWKAVDDVTTIIGGVSSPIPGNSGQFSAPAAGETATRISNVVIFKVGAPVSGRRRGIYILSTATYGDGATGGSILLTTIQQAMDDNYSTYVNPVVAAEVVEENTAVALVANMYNGKKLETDVAAQSANPVSTDEMRRLIDLINAKKR